MSLFHCGDSMRNAWFCSPHCCYPSSVEREREHSGTLLSTPTPPQRVHVHTHTHTYTRSHLPTHAHTFPGTFLSLTLCWDILSLPRRWPPPFHLHKCCSITGGWQIKGKKTNNNIRCPAMVLRPKRDKGRASVYLSSDSLPLWGYFGGNIRNNILPKDSCMHDQIWQSLVEVSRQWWPQPFSHMIFMSWRNYTHYKGFGLIYSTPKLCLENAPQSITKLQDTLTF